MIDSSKALSWRPPADWIRITTIDAHTEGEPLRVIVAGYPELPGTRVLERRAAARDLYDHLRTTLMWEPRGHADMYGCLIVPAERPESDFGVIFLHNEGYSTMCGHGIIAVTTVLLECGIIAPRGNVVRIDSPAGLITARARIENERVRSVRFLNVPSFAAALDQQVLIPGLGAITYDLAFGGAYYAYVDVAQTGLTCTPADYRRLIDVGMQIKHAVMRAHTIDHPGDPDLAFLYGTIFIGPPENPAHHSRNVCVFADGEVDRSPTGTGVSGRVALHHARGEVKDETIVIESILGTTFSVRVADRTRVGQYDAVIPEVEGTAHITGKHEFCIDPQDPLVRGFFLR